MLASHAHSHSCDCDLQSGLLQYALLGAVIEDYSEASTLTECGGMDSYKVPAIQHIWHHCSASCIEFWVQLKMLVIMAWNNLFPIVSIHSSQTDRRVMLCVPSAKKHQLEGTRRRAVSFVISTLWKIIYPEMK